MHIDTSRGHLPLQHQLQGFQVFEVWNVEMKRQSKRLSIYSDSVTHPCVFSTEDRPSLTCDIVLIITRLGSARAALAIG